MPLPADVAALIETFRNNEADYTRPEFKEARLRQQFLDPLFNALGWDTANTAGYAEAYKEVVHEDAIRIRGETKAPDYSFRIGGQRKFFVEAKKPSVNIKDDPAPAYQLRRYSWTVGLPLGILTDFQEISIYDTRVRPRAADKASTARLFHWRYTDLPAKWDEFAGLFSKDAILKGAFDRFANAKRGKHGTSAFDVEFLADIEKWRELLARNIALRNPALNQRELNFSVQRILDRIIFLRIAEARGIEPFGQLQSLTAAAGGGAVEEEPAAYGGTGGAPARRQTIYPRLREIFERADFRYNSGLFHFEKEKDRDESPDKLTLTLSLDDLPLRQIINALYYPESPYAFDYIEADILGSIYERFLGKTIRLTDGHRALIEEKPEVRKAGGVYYTPGYIVSYIVRQTLDPLLENKTPKQAEKIKVLDPACGSGSFLIGAYQYLLDWHLRYYTANDPRKHARQKNPPVYETSPNARGIGEGDNNWQLTTAERKRILLANIHGVDIDAQAVEVTKLALLLKVLEGEARELQGRQMDFHRVLPDLGKNIQCGNSLIGHDFYEQPELPFLDDEAKYKLNTFEWKDGFPEIMKSGGFDAVIGNPPYVRIQTLQETQPEAVAYLNTHYAAAAKGNYDIYVCFIEKALKLLNSEGLAGYIVPHKFFNSEYGKSLRAYISKGRHISGIIHFGHQQVFEGATTYTAIVKLSKKPVSRFHFSNVEDLKNWQDSHRSKTTEIQSKTVTSEPWNFTSEYTLELRDKLKTKGKPLGEIADIFVGLQTSADDVFVFTDPAKIEKQILRRFLTTDELSPYSPARANAWMLFPYAIEERRAQLTSAARLSQDFPHAWGYLKSHMQRLQEREHGKWKTDEWYAFGRSQNLAKMAAPKLIIQVTALRPTVILDETGLHMTGGGSGPFYGIRPTDENYSLIYLLAILNSRVFGWIVRGQSTVLRGGYVKFSKQYIETVPIPLAPKSIRDKISNLASLMLQCSQRYEDAKTPDTQTRLQREITATDRQINTLVYQLYDLTAPEIALVEQTVV